MSDQSREHLLEELDAACLEILALRGEQATLLEVIPTKPEQDTGPELDFNVGALDDVAAMASALLASLKETPAPTTKRVQVEPDKPDDLSIMAYADSSLLG